MLINHSVRFASYALFVMACLTPAAVAVEPEPGWPSICKQSELLKAIRIIDSACEDLKHCDHRKLKQLDRDIDKPTLFAALRNQYLMPLHFFFPRGKSRVEEMVDWPNMKTQLASLKFLSDPENSVVFVIGQASTVAPRSGADPHEYNFSLSQERMTSVMDYLEKTVNVKCYAFHGGWLGDDVFQLTKTDAARMGIDSAEYENNVETLNQAVHIFVFPCGPLLPQR